MKASYLIKKSPIVLSISSKQNFPVVDLTLSKAPKECDFLGTINVSKK